VPISEHEESKRDRRRSETLRLYAVTLITNIFFLQAQIRDARGVCSTKNNGLASKTRIIGSTASTSKVIGAVLREACATDGPGCCAIDARIREVLLRNLLVLMTMGFSGALLSTWHHLS